MRTTTVPFFSEPFDAHRLLVNAIRADHGELRDLKMALESGADVNRLPGDDHQPPLKSAEQGASPLLLAVQAGRDLEWIDLLIKAGADVERTNAWGNGPLLIAMRNNRGDVVARLLDAGADTTIDYGGAMGVKRLVHLAAEADRTDRSLRALIHGGVPVNDPDMVGKTPLHYAAWSNRVVNVQTLLDLGADPLARNRDQKTALDIIASLADYGEIQRLLTKAELLARIQADHAMLRAAIEAEVNAPAIRTPRARL